MQNQMQGQGYNPMMQQPGMMGGLGVMGGPYVGGFQGQPGMMPGQGMPMQGQGYNPMMQQQQQQQYQNQQYQQNLN